MIRDPQKPAVLTVVYADGYSETYGNPDLVSGASIVFPFAANVATGRKAEELIGEVLPPKYRGVFFPGWKLAANKTKRLAPTDIERIVLDGMYLEAIGSDLTNCPMAHRIRLALGFNGRG